MRNKLKNYKTKRLGTKLFDLNRKTRGQNDQISFNTDELNETEQKFIVYISNLNTNLLKDNDIDNLIGLYFKNKNKTNIEIIKTIKVFKNCLYIYFDNETDAIEASKFFDKLQFNSSKLNSIFLNDKYSILNENNNYDFDDESNYQSSLENSFTYEHKKLHKLNIECEILVSNRQLKKYTDSINDKLQKDLFGLNTFVKYSNSPDMNEEELITKEILRDSFNRNLLYLIYLNQSNEKFNSINLIIFNKWRLEKSCQNTHTFKEYKNIPMNKAFEVLRSNYRDYIDFLKQTFNKNTSIESETNDYESETEQDNLEEEEKLESTKNFFHLTLKKFNQLDRVNLEDLDFLITFLNKQKSDLISKNNDDEEVDVKKDNSNINARENITQQTQSTNLPPLIPPSTLPSLMPQMSNFYQPGLIHSHINLIQPINHPPSLMSIMNTQPQTPSLMSLQTNFNMNINQRNLINNFKRF